MSSEYKGDKGFTDLIGENNISKADARLQAIGAVDEAWAALGFARSLVQNESRKAVIIEIQKELSRLMSQLAGMHADIESTGLITTKNVDHLDTIISEIESKVSVPRGFIISGETPAGGALALARAIVRRAERQVVMLLNQVDTLDTVIIAYLNRLSSVCFMLELAEVSEAQK